MNDKKKRCPDFKLAPLVSFGPGKLRTDLKNSKNRELTSFMLTLAVVYNDFKGLEWWLKQLNRGRPPGDELTSYFGQWHGFLGQIIKLTIGIFHSLLENVSDNLALLKSPQFLLLTKKLPSQSRNDWNILINIAENWKSSTPQIGTFNGFLHRIRSKVAFHYDRKELQNGYNDHFAQSTKFAEKAYVSLGKDMEATRFYYADAATQKAINKVFDHHQIDFEEIHNYRNKMNQPIKHLLEAFLSSHGIEARKSNSKRKK